MLSSNANGQNLWSHWEQISGQEQNEKQFNIPIYYSSKKDAFKNGVGTLDQNDGPVIKQKRNS